MKKIIFKLAIIVFVSVLFTACMEEEIKPRGGTEKEIPYRKADGLLMWDGCSKGYCDFT